MKHIILIATALASAYFNHYESQTVKSPRIKIDACELNTKYEIIGPLGEPLGKVIDIRAKKLIDSELKGLPAFLKVTCVNNQKLEESVRIRYRFHQFSKEQNELKEGTEYQLRIYQGGAMIGTPAQVMEETVQFQDYDYHFATEAIILKAAPIKSN